MKQVMCWMVLVAQDVLHTSKTASGDCEDGAHLWKSISVVLTTR